MLTIHLLGAVTCRIDDGAAVQLHAPRLQALLAYLLIHRNMPTPRQHLAALFWPDTTDSQARTNLRNLLRQLRVALPAIDQFLVADPTQLCWQMSAAVTVDVALFDAHLAAAQTPDLHQKRHALEHAIACYTGDLAAGCYDEWLLPLREQYQERLRYALADLSDVLEALGEPQAALAVAQRLLYTDPLRETVYVRLMRLYALGGDRASALRVYHQCASTLIDELGVEPAAETRGLYERLLKRDEMSALPAPETSGPLVGRAAEWQRLQRCWHNLRAPTCVVLRGEAGIGKTRMAEDVLGWATRQGFTAAIARCYATAGDLPLAPVVALLRAPAFQQAVQRLDLTRRGDLARLLPELVAAQPQQPGAGSDLWQRRRMFDALIHVILDAVQPTLLVIDDVQWCDADTLDLLQILMRSRQDARLMLVLTVRDEDLPDEHPLHQMLAHTQRASTVESLALARLSDRDTATLARQLLGSDLPAHELGRLISETEGIPLFVVETVRSRAAGAAPLAQARMQSVIDLRLQSLSERARGLVQVAAVIGRAFGSDVLLHASQMPEDDVTTALDELWQRKIIRTEDATRYDFTHDKLRTGVLAHLRPMHRRMLHQRVARALIATTAYDLDRVSAQVASHLDQGGQGVQAIMYYQRAAQVAHRLGALGEAIESLQRALTLLLEHAETPDRAQTERAIQLALFPLLLARLGYSAPAVEQTLRRAYALCQNTDQPEQLFRVLWGLGRFYLVQPNLDAGLAIGKQMLALAQSHHSLHFLLESHNSLGALQFHRGDLQAASEHFAAALAIYSPVLHSDHALLYGQDPGIVSHTRLGWTLWFLGQPAQALAQAEQALALIEQSQHPFSNAFGLAYVAQLLQFAGELEQAGHHAARASQLAQMYGFPLFQGMADQVLGWLQVQRGDYTGGLAALEAGLALFRSTGAELGLPYYAYLHADAARLSGNHRRSHLLVHEGHAAMERTGERWVAPLLAHLRHQLEMTGS